MAIVYSVEYNAMRIAAPHGRVYAYETRKRSMPFHFLAQTAAGTAGDTWYLGTLPPRATVVMPETWIRWSTFTSGATLSVGWLAYKATDGSTTALSAAGLLSAVSLTVNGMWSHGMLVVATPDDSLPVVYEKDFDNMGEVSLYATIGAQAPGVGAILEGRIGFYAA